MIYLRDHNAQVVQSWRKVLAGLPIDISQGSIFGTFAKTYVSPANSFGWMDGGIDRLYARRWPGLAATLQDAIRQLPGGELPVGEAIVVETGENGKKLIASPTMRTPSYVSGTQNAYLAFRAVLRLEIDNFVCPGLCTGVGGMDPYESARQIRQAYEEAN